MEDNRARISYNLKSLRESAKLTQENLAFASGLTTACVSRLERGHGNPTVATLDHLADALKVRTVLFFHEAIDSPEGRAQTELQRLFRDALEMPAEKQQELLVILMNYLQISWF